MDGPFIMFGLFAVAMSLYEIGRSLSAIAVALNKKNGN